MFQNDKAAHARWLGEAFRSVDWLIPAYLTMKLRHGLAVVVKKADGEQKLVVFKGIMSYVYTPDYIASLYMYQHKAVDHVSDFAVHIDEAIKAYYSGFHHVAVSSMVPVLKGIIRKVAIANGRDVGQGTSGLLREFDALVE